MTKLNEYYVIANQMQLLDRQIANASHEKREMLYAAREAFLPAYLKLIKN